MTPLSPTDPDATLSRSAASHGPAPEPPAASVPAVPGYELLGELGRGGMGVVYQARQVGLDRVVALKVVLAGGHAGPADRARFRTEAEAIARLQHPGIVQVYEVGEHGGLPYLALEFCPGGSLAQRLAGSPLPPRDAARLVEALARAVQAAHDRSVVHRDLKPQNVLLAADGTPKVADFGLAKKLDAAEGQTRTGAVLGTPSYMAPEQAGGVGPIGPPTDVYALGAILYECLTGRPPFKAATAVETIEQVRTREPVPPTRLQPGTPRDLETVCLKCLQKAPGRRYPSAEALAEELRRYLDGRPILARPVSALERMAKWARRRPAVAGLSAALVLGTAASLAVMTGLYIQSEGRRTATDAANSELAGANERLTRKEADLITERDSTRREKAIADENQRATQRALETADVDAGLRLADQGDLFGALLWFAKPLQEDYGPVQSPEMHRDRLSAYWRSPNRPTLQAVIAHQGQVRSASFSPDGRRILTAFVVVPTYDVSRRILTTGVMPARVWDAESGKPLSPPLQHPSYGARSASFSPDGRRVVTAGDDGTARVWDAESGRPISAPLTHRRWNWSIWFSPDGRRYVGGGPARNTAQVCDAETDLPLSPPLPHQGSIASASFSPDGRRVVTGSDDKTARVWDAESGQPLSPPLPHQGGVVSASFSPDGRRILTASWDKTARVWDAESGQPLTPQLAHQGEGKFASFSPDGRRVVIPSEAKTSPSGLLVGNPSEAKPAQVWDLSPDTRPTEDLLMLVRLYAGQRLDRLGGSVSLSPEEQSTLIQELRAKYPADFSVSPRAALAWRTSARSHW
jgi:WD40 repeat protein